MTAKSCPDPFAPKGDIALVHAALLRFAPADHWKLPFAPPRRRMADSEVLSPEPGADPLSMLCASYGADAAGGLDAIFEVIARDFRRTAREWDEAPRTSEVRENLAALEQAARAFARAAENIDDVSLFSMLGNAMLRRPCGWRLPDKIEPGFGLGPVSVAFVQDPDPQDARSVAFAPEIAREAEWLDPREFFAPTIARAKAIEGLARQVGITIEELGPDRGNPQVHIRSKLGSPPKITLAEDCFALVMHCFGPSGVEKIKTTTHQPSADRPVKEPAFEALVLAMFRYAVGDDYSDKESNFDKAIGAIVTPMRAEANEWRRKVGRPFPLAEQIAGENRRALREK